MGETAVFQGLSGRYSLLDERLCQLVLFVKRWAKLRRIYGQTRGYLGGYAWTLMAIHVAQRVGLVPSLQAAAQPELWSSRGEAYDVAFLSRTATKGFGHSASAPGPHSASKSTVSRLVLGFFDYFAGEKRGETLAFREVSTTRRSRYPSGWAAGRCGPEARRAHSSPWRIPSRRRRPRSLENRLKSHEKQQKAVQNSPKTGKFNWFMAVFGPQSGTSLVKDWDLGQILSCERLARLRGEFRRAQRLGHQQGLKAVLRPRGERFRRDIDNATCITCHII